MHCTRPDKKKKKSKSMIIEHIDVDEKATCESRLFHNQYTSDRVHDVELDRRVNSKSSSSELTLNFNRLSSRHSNRFDVTDSERAHFNQNNSSINFIRRRSCSKCCTLWHLHPEKSINKTKHKTKHTMRRETEHRWTSSIARNDTVIAMANEWYSFRNQTIISRRRARLQRR